LQSFILPAYAKINLALDVLGKRDDGYHEIKTVFQSIALADWLRFTPSPSKDIILKVVGGAPLKTEENLVYKAAHLLRRQRGFPGVKITLFKIIPSAAGLGGGSSDAASTLLGLNYLFNLGFTSYHLMEMGSFLGMDVPFFFLGGTALGSGRGEKLSLLPHLPPTWLVLIKPSFGIRTAFIYQNLVQEERKPSLIDEIIYFLEEGKAKEVWRLGFNALEKTVEKYFDEVSAIKKEASARGALKTFVTGSGPTVCAVVENLSAAQKLAREMKNNQRRVIITHTI